MIFALEEGVKQAQDVLQRLNMAPKKFSQEKEWFFKPWWAENANPKCFAFTGGKSICGKHGDAEVFREDLLAIGLAQELTEQARIDELIPNLYFKFEIVDDDVDAVTIIEGEACHAICELLNGHEDPIIPISILFAVVSIIQFDGNRTFKFTLVLQLSNNPFLSKDRLARIKNIIYYNSEDYL